MKNKQKGLSIYLAAAVIAILVIGALVYINKELKDTKDLKAESNNQQNNLPLLSLPSAASAKPGDRIGKFVITDISYSPSTPKYPDQTITAKFSGNTVITGSYGFNEIQGLCFNVESGEVPEFKEFYDGNYGFCLRDGTNAFKIITGRDVPAINGYPNLEFGSWGKATIEIKNYEMYRFPKEGAGDRAELVRVITQ